MQTFCMMAAGLQNGRSGRGLETPLDSKTVITSSLLAKDTSLTYTSVYTSDGQVFSIVTDEKAHSCTTATRRRRDSG